MDSYTTQRSPMSKKITFYSSLPDFDIPGPQVSSKFIPPWFRKMEGATDGIMTVKKCVPFLDALTGGYMIPLSAEVFWDSEKKEFESNAVIETVSRHYPSQSEDIKIPEEYDTQPHKWLSNWHIKTPKGYSCLITSPLNRLDLPFYCFSGIVDTDKHPMIINLPFVLRKDFHGKIESGTPLVQVIPFKREAWSSSLIEESPGHFYKDQYKTEEPPFGFYKRNFWSRKSFS
jgi:hypothetical protein